MGIFILAALVTLGFALLLLISFGIIRVIYVGYGDDLPIITSYTQYRIPNKIILTEFNQLEKIIFQFEVCKKIAWHSG